MKQKDVNRTGVLRKKQRRLFLIKGTKAILVPLLCVGSHCSLAATDIIHILYNTSAVNAKSVINNETVRRIDNISHRESRTILDYDIPNISRIQQSFVVSGQVTALDGRPLSGASVRVEGTAQGTSTDARGNYRLTMEDSGVLLFTSVGYRTEVRNVSGAGVINISLTSEEDRLEEVVVIGYGATSRNDLTGSVGTVNMEALEKAPVSSFTEGLQGRVAGVQVSAIDGQPGQDLNIVIRGANSLTQSNAPLYVIDGFPIEDPDNGAINPDDIASISILKDASATAIYGARGANGVIIIETKQGKIGSPVVTLNNTIGYQQVQKLIPLMSPYEFVKYQQELSRAGYSSYTRGELDPSETSFDPRGLKLEDYKNLPGINWQEQVFRNTLNRIHSLAVRGGTSQTRYSLSGSAYGQDGILLNSGYDRYQGRVNIDQNLSKKLKIGVNANVSKRKTYGTNVASGEGSSFTTYLLSRVWGYRPISGNFDVNLLEEDLDEEALNQFDARFNPVVTSNNAYQPTFITDLLANAYVEYQFSPAWILKMTGAVSRRDGRNELFFNSKTPQGSLSSAFNSRGINARVNFNERITLSNENTLTYSKKFQNAHSVSIMGGLSFQESSYNAYGFSSQQIPNENLGMSGIDQGTPYASTAYLSEFFQMSGFARANYNYKSRYLVTGTMRADGSSKFSKANRWAYFPSMAVAWNMHEEEWVKAVEVISEIKLRASYGMTGNNRVGEYSRFPSLTQPFGASYSWQNGTPTLGAIVSDLGNEDLKWETTEQIDLGFDIGLFGDRFTATIDVYRKNTSDLLLNAQLPTSTGFSSAMKNIGSVRNEGLEIAVFFNSIRKQDFSWSSAFNISFNRNKILALTEGQDKLFQTPSFESQYNANPLYISEIGRPAGMFYGYIWEGVYTYDDFDNPAEGVYVLKPSQSANGIARASIRPGDIKYRDLNNDGNIDPHDLTVIGRGVPIHAGGFNNDFIYKGLMLNVFFQWSYGNKIYNANRLMFDGNGNVRANLNQYASYADRWSPENPTSDIFRAGGQGVTGYHSDRVLEDGSYLRLKTVSLGYDIPTNLIRWAYLNKLNVSVAAQNLITWTKYTGMDPEVSVRNSVLTPGFDFSAYPIPRTVVFALKATF